MGMDRERSVERFLPLRPVEFDVLLSLAERFETNVQSAVTQILSAMDGMQSETTVMLQRADQTNDTIAEAARSADGTAGMMDTIAGAVTQLSASVSEISARTSPRRVAKGGRSSGTAR